MEDLGSGKNGANANNNNPDDNLRLGIHII